VGNQKTEVNLPNPRRDTVIESRFYPPLQVVLGAGRSKVGRVVTATERNRDDVVHVDQPRVGGQRLAT
jgi:hypothetical protein